MIINFHPKEIPSNKGLEVIAKLNANGTHKVFHSTDKQPKEWQEIIKSKEHLILVAPTYWWGASYEFDKWIQDVFGYGFAFQYNAEGMPEGLLNGREFEMHMTHGTPTGYASNMHENIKLRLETGVFGFCKAVVKLHFYDLQS